MTLFRLSPRSWRTVVAPAALLALPMPPGAETLASGKAAFPFPSGGGTLGIPLPGGISLPFPIPGGGGTGSLPIPSGGSGGTIGIPLPGGISLPFPIPGGGSTGSLPIPGGGSGGTIGIPIPGGGTLPIPIPTGGTGSRFPFPIPSGGQFPLPLPIPTGGSGGQIPFPIPGGGQFPLPIPTGGSGGQIPFPIPGGGTTFPVPDSDSGTRYPGPSASGQPSGYKALMARGRVARVDSLPLQVYSGELSKGRLLGDSIEVWNRAGRQLGVGPMFELVTSPASADFTVDWSGSGLPSGVLGSARLATTRDRVIPQKLTLRSNLNRPDGNVQEIMVHELGHMLGLDHSDAASDLMFHAEHNHRHSSGHEVGLTQRDMQMLSWLYSQQDYIPIGR